MPDPDDPTTTWPEPGSSGEHPVLADMTGAVDQISDAAAFLSPTRRWDEPGLEDSDWPRDLDGPETTLMIGHLAEITSSASACIAGIRSKHSIPGAAKPELGEIDALLSEAARRASVLTGILQAEARGTSASQQAGLDFPDAPAAQPPGPDPGAAPGPAGAPVTRAPKGPGR
jgi:hypothetical protein